MSKLDHFLSLVGGGTKTSTGYKCRCPSHDDRNASLSAREIDGKLLLNCFASKSACTYESILAAVGMIPAEVEAIDTIDLKYNEKPKSSKWYRKGATAFKSLANYMRDKGFKCTAKHQYYDKDGDTVIVQCRFENKEGQKEFRPVVRHSKGKWMLSGTPDNRPLYNLPAVIKSKYVVVTEGEKAADAPDLNRRLCNHELQWRQGPAAN